MASRGFEPTSRGFEQYVVDLLATFGHAAGASRRVCAPPCDMRSCCGLTARGNVTLFNGKYVDFACMDFWLKVRWGDQRASV
jgi:hypothetical protein